MSNITVSPGPAVGLHEMTRMADAMASSGFFGFKTQEQALAIMLIAQANGQHPASAAQDYDVIQGKPAKKPQAMLRDFIVSGGRVDWHEATDAVADATFSHASGGSLRVRWDMVKAQRMGLANKDNWKKQPGVMLRWRCVAEGVRFVYPSSTGGLYSTDEIGDMDARPTYHAETLPVAEEFDKAHGEILRAAASRGTVALLEAFKAAGGAGKADFWKANAESLKATAKAADKVIDAEVVEVAE